MIEEVVIAPIACLTVLLESVIHIEQSQVVSCRQREPRLSCKAGITQIVQFCRHQLTLLYTLTTVALEHWYRGAGLFWGNIALIVF